MNPKVLPILMMALQFVSAIIYLYNGNFRMAIYWFSATTLTASITL